MSQVIGLLSLEFPSSFLQHSRTSM